jgi:phosphate transport system protein
MMNPRHAYAEELRALEHDLLEMGARAERMVGLAIEALVRLDEPLARQVLAQDDDVDRRDMEIETRCLRLLALQQPMAGDLRIVGAALKASTDIERVADLAVDVAKIGMKIEREFGASTDVVDLPRMGAEARAMIQGALNAYVRRDLALVAEVCDRDERVDDMYRSLREQIFEDMRRNPENVVADGWLLLAVHHIERIADHATNIAERVRFMVTGELG